jgi:glycosyltransferase involved in cell wall biosynthesis
VKILFVNNFRSRGGGEEFLRDLLPGLIDKGVRVGLVCRPGTPLVEMFSGSAVELFPIERSGKQALKAVLELARVLKDNRYDIVNIQRGHDIVQTLAAKWISRQDPVLLYTPQVPEFIRSRFLLRRMDAIVTISRYIRDRVVSYDPALASRTSIVYYGIDLGKFKAGAAPGFLRKRFGLDSKVPIIGTVGDLWKNQIEFLDVLAGLRKGHPDVRYAIVGSRGKDELTQAFDERAAELGLRDAIVWAGRLSKDEMMAFYADLDLAVSTYRNEGFGIWLLEAMAMGRPAIAFDAGGIRDSLEGSPCGVLVQGGAPEMADAISLLLNEGRRREMMSASAPVWVKERFGRQRMIEDYERYFRTLIASSRRENA